MAFTTEFVMGTGGPEIIEFQVGTINNTERSIHSFTLPEPSLVAVTLPGITGLSSSGVWVPPGPSLTVTPVGQTVNYGVNWFRTSLFARETGTGIPEDELNKNNAHMSLCAQLPAGTYQVRVRTYGTTRSYTLGNAHLVIVPT